MKKLLLALVLASTGANAQFWTAKATGWATASRGVDCISYADANTIWIKAYDGSGAASQTVKDVSRSTDGGNTWTAATVAGLGIGNSGLSSIAAISGTTAYVSTYPTSSGGSNGIWRTTNSGTNWTKLQPATLFGSASFANFVYFWDANTGIAQGDPENGYFEIWRTVDAGTTWTRVPSANIPAPIAADEYGYVHNYEVIGNTMWFGTNKGRIFRSSDMGVTWEVFQSPLSDFAGTVESGNYTFSDVNKGLLNSSAGNLWSTTDGGETWNTVTPSGVFGNNDLEYIPGTTKVVSTAGPTGYGTFYSLDDGLTWLEGQATTQVTELGFFDETNGLGGGFSTNATTGGIFKYTGNQLAVNDVARKQVTVSPNPTNGNIAVSGAPVFNITVFDLSGKQVYQHDFDGSENVNVDLTSLEQGAYFVRTRMDDGVFKTVKLLKN